MVHCAWGVTLTPHPAPSSVTGHADHPDGELPSFRSLRLQMAAAIHAEAGDIAERWSVQVRLVAAGDPIQPPDSLANDAATLVRVLATSLESGGIVAEEAVLQGLAFGERAHATGSSLHQMLKALHLLFDMTRFAVEHAIEREPTPPVTLRDAVHLIRALDQTCSLLTVAASKAHARAVAGTMRERFRHLRHDLRNPLGTIKSVLALMDDETIPATERTNPRFRAMAKHNVRALGDMITSRLSDVEAGLPAAPRQAVSLRTVACAVRRTLRAEAAARGATVLVAGTRVRVQVDAVDLELLLHELLLVALQDARKEDELRLDFCDVVEGQGGVRLSVTPPRHPMIRGEATERLAILAGRLNAAVEIGDAIVLRFPATRLTDSPTPQDASAAAPADSGADRGMPLHGGESRHDLRRARDREHGQPGTL